MAERIYLDWNATAPLRPEAREASAFLSMYPSTNGPFQSERVMAYRPFLR